MRFACPRVLRLLDVAPLPPQGGLAATATIILSLVAGCATGPDRADALAQEYGYVRSVVDGAGYPHVIYESAGSAPVGVMHVYIEGDGRPYLDRWTVAPDPTPKHPLMLRLMALDSVKSIYVGRPCYFGLASLPPCTPHDWTLSRFSDRVVASLAAVIEAKRAEYRADTVEIYGHSGGGALAVLLAHRMPGVERVVTIAGNLDTDAWVTLHRYSPLTGSRNPVRLGHLPATIRQQHYAGANDKVVPAWMVDLAAPQVGAEAINLPGVTHTCCWEQRWPAILAGEPGAATGGD